MEGSLPIPSAFAPLKGSAPRYGFDGELTSFRFHSIRAFGPFFADGTKNRASTIAHKRRFRLDLYLNTPRIHRFGRLDVVGLHRGSSPLYQPVRP